MTKKYLIIAHGHPNLSKGGGEIAAYNHYQTLRDAGGEAYFLAWNSQQKQGSRALEQITPTEWLIATRVDHFNFSSLNAEAIEAFEALLLSLKPDVVHFHHFIHLGIELPKVVKTTLPGAMVFMTLHEFLLICHNNGQMIKTFDGSLCSAANAKNCSQCFPQITPEAFFMREGYLKNSLQVVDHFFSPSNFLRQRMIGWGIPEGRISYAPNVLKLRPSRKARRDIKNVIDRFGFFGQINPFKGLDLLLDAFEQVLTKRPRARLYINGVVSKVNTPEYNALLTEKLKRLGNAVIVNGAYNPENLTERFAQVGWLVMSSRWWENSPVVIQEAFAANTPIIVPDIGGMVEQYQLTRFGMTFKANDANSLAQKMLEAAGRSVADYERLIAGAPSLPSETELVATVNACVESDVDAGSLASVHARKSSPPNRHKHASGSKQKSAAL